MPAEHSDQLSSVTLTTKSLTKSTLTFAVHQFVGMYGIPFTAPLVFSLGFKVLLLFGYNLFQERVLL